MVIEINTLNTSPIYEQLRDQIVLGIAAKKLALGESLPSVRRLAADLGINFHTVNKAYSMLCDEGYIAMDRRKGAVIAQTEESGEAFALELADKLTMSAAEAICHKVTESEFLAICKQCYKDAGGNLENGGSK